MVMIIEGIGGIGKICTPVKCPGILQKKYVFIFPPEIFTLETTFPGVLRQFHHLLPWIVLLKKMEVGEFIGRYPRENVSS